MQTKFETDKVRPFQFFSPKVDLWKKFIIFKKLGQIDIIINLENENPENLISLEKKICSSLEKIQWKFDFLSI